MSVAKTNTPVARCFQLTINEIDRAGELLDYLRSLSPNYLLAGKEKAPTTGHLHMHIYVQFTTPRRLSLKKCCGAHVEKTRGSTEQNIKYVKKDGDVVVEEGEPRLNHVPTIGEAKKMEDLSGLNLGMYNIVQKIEAEKKKIINPQDYYKKVEVYWIWGESGAGKTRYAVNDMLKKGITGFNEVKMVGEFWHGVQEDCEVALYDDWRDNHMKPTELINFIDYNKHIMNVKGGSVRNNYKTIYITSLQSPEQIYTKVPEETQKQWLRRIKEIIHLDREQGNSLGEKK